MQKLNEQAVAAEAIASGALTEDQRVEFKREVDLDDHSKKRDFVDDVVGFLDAGAGHLFVGVAERKGRFDRFHPVFGDLDKLRRRYTSIIQDNIVPKQMRVSVDFLDVDGGHLVVIDLPEHRMRPYQNAINGAFHVRTGAQNTPLSWDAVRAQFTSIETMEVDVARLMEREDRAVADRGILQDGGATLHVAILPIERYDRGTAPFNPGRPRGGDHTSDPIRPSARTASAKRIAFFLSGRPFVQTAVCASKPAGRQAFQTSSTFLASNPPRGYDGLRRAGDNASQDLAVAGLAGTSEPVDLITGGDRIGREPVGDAVPLRRFGGGLVPGPRERAVGMPIGTMVSFAKPERFTAWRASTVRLALARKMSGRIADRTLRRASSRSLGCKRKTDRMPAARSLRTIAAPSSHARSRSAPRVLSRFTCQPTWSGSAARKSSIRSTFNRLL